MIETKTFNFENGDTVTTHFDNAGHGQWWLTVNGEEGEKTGYYQGIYAFKGYLLATEYWNGVLPVEVPFKIIEGEEVK